MKPLLLSILLFFTVSLSSKAQSDPLDALNSHFKAGNSKEIAKFFAASVDLNVLDKEDVYSKAQAEQIIRDFLVKHPPVSFTKVHTVGNATAKYRFGVIVLSTKKGSFRVSTSLNKSDLGYLITELKIESEK